MNCIFINDNGTQIIANNCCINLPKTLKQYQIYEGENNPFQISFLPLEKIFKILMGLLKGLKSVYSTMVNNRSTPMDYVE